MLLFILLIFVGELTIFIKNFYRPTQNTVIAGVLFGAIHIFSGTSGATLGVAIALREGASGTSVEEIVLMGVLWYTASLGFAGVMFGSSVYGNARLKDSAARHAPRAGI